ncbi:DMT family transporter [Paracoccus sp. M683]|uniref:DMT family transporter n=1 Tax=Paracoccus sp. M683 TaxID=2594268 RepID=UPI00118176FD|nr:DMT family transporter [Paracoccus sp. M683]TRW95032.1 DMT family transporter [Paracoccus sp. M683]
MNKAYDGWASGFLGVLIFSGSLPATRVAVADFGPMFLTSARAVIAAMLAGLLLVLLRQGRPSRADLGGLCIVSIGVVLGFPLLTALALQQITSAHSIVFIGLLPLATAIFGVVRGGERPRPVFWIFSGAGSLAVALYAWTQGDGGTMAGDLLMLAAIVLCGLGYAEGAVLSRRLGGWQVISWALLLSLPAMLALVWLTWPQGFQAATTQGVLSLGYVSVFSMMIGFVFWYRGLALGGIAKVGQLQLLQPFFGLLLAGLLLGEPVDASMIVVTLLVVTCVAGARRYA